MTIATAFLAVLFIVFARADVVCPEIVCYAGAIDLVFVMDESGSVGLANYKLGLQAAQKLTQSLDIGIRIDQSHVGFVVFNAEAFVAFNLNSYLTNAAVFDAIGKIGYSGGDNNIAKGMDVAIKQVFRPYGRTGVPRIMIIITDGQDSSDVGAERSQAAESRIRTYALGVGPAADVGQLTRATGDVNRVYSVSNYADLQKIMDQVCEEIAVSVAPPVPTTPPPPAHKPRSCGCDSEEDYVSIWLDVVFVVDSSDTVAQDDFDNIITLLDQIGMFYTIGTGNPSTPNKYTRVAIINAAADAYRFADFSKYKTGAEMSKDVRANLKKLKGRFDVEKGIKAAQDMFDEETEARRRLNVRKVVVLFSTEAVDCRTETVDEMSRSKFQVKAENKELCRLVSQMHGDNVAIITAAMKLPEEKNYPFMDITEPCDRLVNNEEMVDRLMKRLCLANCYCLDPYTQFEVVDTCEKYRECIFVHDMALSYAGAQKTCARENEKLTDVFSKDKNEFLKSLHLNAGFFPYWIGGKASGNTINWDCGIQGASSDFYNWGDAQPDGKNECVFMKQYQGFKTAWYSDKCGMMTPTHFFSCQKDACSANNYCDFDVRKNAH